MKPPATDNEPSVKPRCSALAALGWGFACAICAGGCWLAVFVLGDVRIYALNDTLRWHSTSIRFVTALNSALGGLLGGTFLKLFDATRSQTPRVLAWGGAVTGAVGGDLTIEVVIRCRPWLSPLASSTLLWCLIGFFAGTCSYGLSLWLSATSVRAVENQEAAVNSHDRPHQLLSVRLFYFLVLAAFAFVVFALSTARYLD